MKPITFSDYQNKYESIRLDRANGVLEMTLHTGGESLVFDRTIHEELGFAFADIAADRENRVVILTGAGKDFCAQFDPESFEAFNGLGPDITATGWDQTHWRGLHNIRAELDIPVPMIGVLNGPALAHSELALLCDVVLASETATIQDEPHFGNGVAPGDGVHVVFPLLMGINPGRYFLLTQQVLNAHDAKAAGLVNEVLSPRSATAARPRTRRDDGQQAATGAALRPTAPHLQVETGLRGSAPARPVRGGTVRHRPVPIRNRKGRRRHDAIVGAKSMRNPR